MRKACLIIDMPESCNTCPFRKEGYCMPYKWKNALCGVYHEMRKNTKPDWCPLRPLPEKNSTDVDKTDSGYYFTLGWNECLDKIMKTD